MEKSSTNEMKNEYYSEEQSEIIKSFFLKLKRIFTVAVFLMLISVLLIVLNAFSLIDNLPFKIMLVFVCVALVVTSAFIIKAYFDLKKYIKKIK